MTARWRRFPAAQTRFSAFVFETPAYGFAFCAGEVAEWSIAPHSKCGVSQGTVGSNPTLSASFILWTRCPNVGQDVPFTLSRMGFVVSVRRNFKTRQEAAAEKATLEIRRRKPHPGSVAARSREETAAAVEDSPVSENGRRLAYSREAPSGATKRPARRV